MSGELVVRERRKVGVAYALWALSLFMIPGLHRFYLKRPLSGILWLCTGGLFGLGTLLDAVFMPRMVDDTNAGRGW